MLQRSTTPHSTPMAFDHDLWCFSLTLQGKYAEAEPLYARATEIWETAFGPDHQTVATALNNRAVLLYKQEKYTEAISLLKRALSIRTKKLGENHPDTVSSQNTLEIVRKKV
ncbi:unnamed protein product [Ectocarpus sp. 12 AP-2014]